VLGPSPDGDASVYNRILDAFNTQKVATQGRAVMIVPLHKELKSMVVVWAPCCGAMTAEDYIRYQWRECDRLAVKYLEPIGLFQTGKASDGASTRRKPQYEQMTAVQGDGYERYGLNVPGFTLTGAAIRKNDRLIRLLFIHDQDYMHCAKKMLGSCDHAVRRLMVGAHCAHMHAVLLVLNTFRPDQHKIWSSDVTRKGKNAMNWASVVRVISKPCLDCMAQLAGGVRRAEVIGMLWFLRLIRRYIGLFCDPSLTPLGRIGGAWYVITTFRCWRLWILMHPVHTLGKNFMTRECFQDVVLNCFSLILTLMAVRDMTTSRTVCVHGMGSNDCETLFAELGSMVGNRRVYTYLQGLHRISNRNHIGVIRSRGDIVFPRRNRALETNLQVDRPTCTLPVTETNEVMEQEMVRRGADARADLIVIGMGPPPGPIPAYWTTPELYESGNLKKTTDKRMYRQAREDMDLHADVVDDREHLDTDDELSDPTDADANGELSDTADADADEELPDAADTDVGDERKDGGVIGAAPAADPPSNDEDETDRVPGHALLWYRQQLSSGLLRNVLVVGAEQLRLHGLFSSVRLTELLLVDGHFTEVASVGCNDDGCPVIYIGHVGRVNHYVWVEVAAPDTAISPAARTDESTYWTGTPRVTLQWQGDETFVGRLHDHGAFSHGRLGPLDDELTATEEDRGLARLTRLIGLVGGNCCSWTHVLVGLWQLGLLTQDEFLHSVDRPRGIDNDLNTMWHPLLGRRVYKQSVTRALCRATFDGKVSTDRVVRYTSPATGAPRLSTTHRNLQRDSWKISIFDDVAVKFIIDQPDGRQVLEEAFGRVFRIHRRTDTGLVEYERAVDLSPVNFDRPKRLQVTLHYYTRVADSDPPRYTFGQPDYEPVALETVICPVDMRLLSDGTFTVDPDHAAVVRDCMNGATVMMY
jgi:hypothetical protein